MSSTFKKYEDYNLFDLAEERDTIDISSTKERGEINLKILKIIKAKLAKKFIRFLDEDIKKSVFIIKKAEREFSLEKKLILYEELSKTFSFIFDFKEDFLDPLKDLAKEIKEESEIFFLQFREEFEKIEALSLRIEKERNLFLKTYF